MERIPEEIKNIFENYGATELFGTVSHEDFEMRGNDLYFFDPMWELGIALGNTGDGWVCIQEGAEDGIFTTWTKSDNNQAVFTEAYAENIDKFKEILNKNGVKIDGQIFKKALGLVVELE